MMGKLTWYKYKRVLGSIHSFTLQSVICQKRRHFQILHFLDAKQFVLVIYLILLFYPKTQATVIKHILHMHIIIIIFQVIHIFGSEILIKLYDFIHQTVIVISVSMIRISYLSNFGKFGKYQ